MLMNTTRTVCTTLALLVGLSVPAGACQIPVFRYALENWLPEPYLLIVAHRGRMSDEDLELLSQLELAVDQARGKLNLELKVVDLSQTKDPVLETVLGEKIRSIQAPQMVLLFPFDEIQPPAMKTAPVATAAPAVVDGRTAAPSGQTTLTPGLTPAPTATDTCPDGKCGLRSGWARVAWRGDLTSENIRQVLHSPARQEITDRLLAGHSTVWVLLECGDKSKDDAAVALLEKSLATMQRELKLPDRQTLEADEHYKPETKVELKIEFSLVRMAHGQADEAVFAATLMASDPKLDVKNEPVAVSVFGRARAYSALAGEDITAEAVEQQCQFLTDDCSCQVKEDNPGVDLLCAVSWNTQIQKINAENKPLPAPGGLGVFAPQLATPQGSSAVVAGTTKEGTETAEPPQSSTPAVPALAPPASTNSGAQEAIPSSSLGLSWLVGPAVLCLIAVLAGSLWLRRSQQPG